MENIIENFKLQPLKEANFVKTALATYRQNGIEKSWEIVESHDSVAILIYHTERKSFVLVEQFRPPLYHNNGDGMSVELCAGILDKEISVEQIAQEEVEEECGFAVALDSIERISKVNSALCTSGTTQIIFYVEVDESMRVGEGGGVDDEMIEVIELPVAEARAFMFDESIAKTAGLMFAFMWWFDKYQTK
jgi:UDP-sugar diphosphatase